MKNTLAFIMAGGRGERLMPLTQDRTKPAVPFGGIYRLIDFTLSNCVNSMLYRIIVLPQYKSQSLYEHLENGWSIFSSKIGHFLKIVPPQQRTGLDWYKGTADSIRQNIYLIERYNPQDILVLSGDHIYKMDYTLFLDFHREQEADVTISFLEAPRDMAGQLGVGEADSEFRLTGFREKPKGEVKTIPGDSEHILASMGIYLFRAESLLKMLESEVADDFGRDIIPNILQSHKVAAYPYKQKNQIKDYVYDQLETGERRLRFDPHTRDSAYWRDVGTLDSYWNANMDLTGVDPYFNLYGTNWPIYTYQIPAPPAKFIFADEEGNNPRVGKALDSLVGAGSIVSGVVRNCVVSRNVFIRSWSNVEESVVMDDVVVGRHCRIKKAIIDKDNEIPPNTEIGYHPLEDKKRFTVTPRGIVAVPRGYYS